MNAERKIKCLDMIIYTKIYEIKKELERRENNIIGDNQYYKHSKSELIKILDQLEEIYNVIETEV